MEAAIQHHLLNGEGHGPVTKAVDECDYDLVHPGQLVLIILQEYWRKILGAGGGGGGGGGGGERKGERERERKRKRERETSHTITLQETMALRNSVSVSSNTDGHSQGSRYIHTSKRVK